LYRVSTIASKSNPLQQETTVTRTRTKSQHHLQRSLISQFREQERGTRLVLHLLKLAEEASVRDVVGDVEMHPATKEVRQLTITCLETWGILSSLAT
jgi:hypothetical protein